MKNVIILQGAGETTESFWLPWLKKELERRGYENYKRQMEIYQWLLRQNGFKVLNRGYFVYCRVNKNNGFANGNLSFDIKVQPYDGDDSWVEGKILEAKKILSKRSAPKCSNECIYCKYTRETTDFL